MHYEQAGYGRPVVFLHGLLASSYMWRNITHGLTYRNTVYQPDLMGFGFSEKPHNVSYSLATYVAQLGAFLDTLHLDDPILVGHDIGAAIVLLYTLRNPDKVRKLILGCTVAQVARFHVSILQVWKWIRQHDPDNEVFPIEAIVWGMTHDFLKNAAGVDQMIEGLRNPQFPVSPEAYGRQADAARAFDVLDRVGAVTVPTLVLVGDQDILTPPWASRKLAAAIPGAKLQVIEGGAHGFFLEIPESVNKAVLDFLMD